METLQETRETRYFDFFFLGLRFPAYKLRERLKVSSRHNILTISIFPQLLGIECQKFSCSGTQHFISRCFLYNIMKVGYGVGQNITLNQNSIRRLIVVLANENCIVSGKLLSFSKSRFIHLLIKDCMTLGRLLYHCIPQL